MESGNTGVPRAPRCLNIFAQSELQTLEVLVENGRGATVASTIDRSLNRAMLERPQSSLVKLAAKITASLGTGY